MTKRTTCWSYPRIAQEVRSQVLKVTREDSRERLIERLIELQIALYPLATVFESMDDTFESRTMTSDLFPVEHATEDGYYGYASGPHKAVMVPSEQIVEWINDPANAVLHAESLRWKGAELADTVCLLSGGASESVCSIQFGAITMFEARNIVALSAMADPLVDARGEVADQPNSGATPPEPGDDLQTQRKTVLPNAQAVAEDAAVDHSTNGGEDPTQHPAEKS